MKHIKKYKMQIVLTSILLMLVLTASAIAQKVRYPTWEYYGQVLDVDAFMALVEQETPLACTEIPTETRFVNERSTEIDYICFDTQAELDVHITAVISPRLEELARIHPDVQRSQPDS